MQASSLIRNNNSYLFVIGLLSVAIPVAVAVLFYIPQTGKLGDLDVSFLPHLNAVLNSATAVSLIAGYVFIKKGKRSYHITAMLTAFTLSSIFLVSYVIYHFQGAHTIFGDLDHSGALDPAEKVASGAIRYVYLILLLTHILLATIIVPFVLFSIYFGWSKQYSKHKRLSRWTFPMWLYVAITGVLVYLMISPYYPNH